jgi:hypothetical protein
MRFWVIKTKDDEEVIGCELSKKDAKAAAAAMGYRDAIVEWVNVPVTAESICRLLGNKGGYAEY